MHRAACKWKEQQADPFTGLASFTQDPRSPRQGQKFLALKCPVPQIYTSGRFQGTRRLSESIAQEFCVKIFPDWLQK
ncbi:hypothetical protein Y1Q_0007261 [Alligator mississippiensis]|uniref:Uncharacterized protein n=1 Tax=Alligator mississippiensis TaxID=8496 RepID=A0A151NMT2_ALLMI|nr:hypothetical protein Y1Q_0007261 [Alligator mississippiensis]